VTPDRSVRLAEAMAGVSFLWHPPDWEGNTGLGIPGLSSVARPVPWDAVASASLPGVRGDELRFAMNEDGETVCGEMPAEALRPLVAAVRAELQPPFCAVAVRDEADVWSAAANRAEIVDLGAVPGERIELSRIAGTVSARVDGADSELRCPQLEDVLDRGSGDATVIANRFLGSIWAVDAFPL
jgi:hypothetical protein